MTSSLAFPQRGSSDFFRQELGRVDWNFPDLRNEGLHSLHWYPATFLSAIPGTLIPLLTEPAGLVVDPFCGTCTAGLEGVRLGRRFEGADTNPVAVLIAKAKLLFSASSRLQDRLGGDRLASLFLETQERAIQHPNERELLKWYHPTTFRELEFILSTIREVEQDDLRTVAQAIFSSILKAASSQTRHWGWVCDNVAPKAEDIQYKSALDLYRKSLEDYLESSRLVMRDMEERGTASFEAGEGRWWKIQCSDAVTFLAGLESGTVSLIITSPPYYGVADYIKSQRLSFLWFASEVLAIEGYSSTDFELLRKTEVGSRSFRWHHQSLQRYTDYMHGFFGAAHLALKQGGLLAMVTGESDARESTADILDKSAEAAGFRPLFFTKRDIKKTRRRLMAKVRNERIGIFLR